MALALVEPNLEEQAQQSEIDELRTNLFFSDQSRAFEHLAEDGEFIAAFAEFVHETPAKMLDGRIRTHKVEDLIDLASRAQDFLRKVDDLLKPLAEQIHEEQEDRYRFID